MTPDWDADLYHRISAPQWAFGLKVLEDLPLTGGETVIDAGCGSGRLTAELLMRLPRGRIIAVDSSEAMLAKARQELQPGFGERVQFVCADLVALPFDAVADVLFSTVTFHWVLDHDLLFAQVHRALKPGGLLWAQCGGAGNLSLPGPRPHGVRERHRDPARPGGLRGRGDLPGPNPFPFADRATLAEFLRAVVLRHHLGRLPAPLRTPYLAAVEDAMASDGRGFVLDDVGLNLRARRG